MESSADSLAILCSSCGQIVKMIDSAKLVSNKMQKETQIRKINLQT